MEDGKYVFYSCDKMLRLFKKWLTSGALNTREAKGVCG